MVRCSLLLCLAFVIVGCDKEKASEIVKDAEKTGGALADKGGALAGQLGQQAMAWMTPLKEKFGNLEGLKESPEKLKEAVSGLIEMIEKKAGSIKLPESMSSAMNVIKEKLVALQDYLKGEVEQTKVDEHVAGITDAVKSKLGF